MTTIQLAWLNGWEIVGILVIVLVLFGAKKLPELARGLGKGIQEFKKASREVQDEIHNAMDSEPPAPPRTENRVAEKSPSEPQPVENTVAQGSSPESKA